MCLHARDSQVRCPALQSRDHSAMAGAPGPLPVPLGLGIDQGRQRFREDRRVTYINPASDPEATDPTDDETFWATVEDARDDLTRAIALNRRCTGERAFTVVETAVRQLVDLVPSVCDRPGASVAEVNRAAAAALAARLPTMGYSRARVLSDGSVAAICELIWTRAICLGVTELSWSRRFCFADRELADRRFVELQSEDDEPAGFVARRPA